MTRSRVSVVSVDVLFAYGRPYDIIKVMPYKAIVLMRHWPRRSRQCMVTTTSQLKNCEPHSYHQAAHLTSNPVRPTELVCSGCSRRRLRKYSNPSFTYRGFALIRLGVVTYAKFSFASYQLFQLYHVGISIAYVTTELSSLTMPFNSQAFH